MALKRPPRHRVDAKPVYVHHADEAWDYDRIGADAQKMDAHCDEHGLPRRQHVVASYHAAETRYDLDAVQDMPGVGTFSARDYLRPEKGPWFFSLKRLGWAEHADVAAKLMMSNRHGLVHAARIGLRSIDGPGAPRLEHDLSGLLSDMSTQALFEIDLDLLQAIGAAVWHASRPLSEPEKKA